MLRHRAVRSLLVEDIAGLRPRGSGDVDGADGEPGEIEDDLPGDPDRSDLAEMEAAAELEALAQAERRAKLVVLLDWMALAVLFVFRDTAGPFLPFDGTIETVFTLGVLAVALHSGFRLGQLEKYRAVSRAYDGLR